MANRALKVARQLIPSSQKLCDKICANRPCQKCKYDTYCVWHYVERIESRYGKDFKRKQLIALIELGLEIG